MMDLLMGLLDQERFVEQLKLAYLHHLYYPHFLIQDCF